MKLSELPQYNTIDPHDFRVGHRYHPAPPGQEHGYTVDRIELVGARIIVHTFNGRSISYPADVIAYTTGDLPGA